MPTPREGGRFHGYPEIAVVEDETSRYLLTELPCPEGLWRRALGVRTTGLMTEARTYSIEDVEHLPRRDGSIFAGGELPASPFQQTRPFIHLHAHSEYSALDGLSKISEMIAAVKADGQEYLAVTDHGVCSGHLELQSLANKEDIRPVFGTEAYWTPDAKVKEKGMRYNHLVLLAKNNKGLQNLWGASTVANLPENSYYKPRMDWLTFDRFAEGLIATTACLRGPFADDLIEERKGVDEHGNEYTYWVPRGDHDRAIQKLARMRRSFKDNIWAELHANQLPQQRVLNEALVQFAQSQSLGMILVGDSHYPCHADEGTHRIWMAVQTNKDLQDEPELFQGHQDYHLHTAEEAFQSIRYLGDDIAAEAVQNTFEIAKTCDASITSRPTTPIYHRNNISGSEHQAADLDYHYMYKIAKEAQATRFPIEVVENPDSELAREYQERFEMEMETFREKGFCGYHLIVWDYCNWCRDNRILMGPGRGSAAGSLVCFLLGITQVDSIEADLLFERYISPGRTSLPDIDSDFPASKRPEVTEYIVNRWGNEHVVRVGTVTRLRNKGVFKDLARVFKGSEDEVEWADSAEISKIIDEAEAHTAGLGLPWDDLWAQEGERLEPFAEKYPTMFGLAQKMVGRVKTYGKHPAGLVIDTMDPVVDRLPMRQGEEEGYPVSEFTMDALDLLGLTKFDILTLRTLDTIQSCMDHLEADPRYAGKIPHPHTWREEYKDPQVWESLCDGDTLGVFQVETSAGTHMTKQIQPRNLADMCAIGALNRPGPLRSGLADSFIARRAGREDVAYAHPLLTTVLDKTYGTMIYQENIMKTVQVIAGYTSEEADEVRSILGKKKVDKIAAEGQRFVVRATALGIDQGLAERMFAQMAEFARYSFNKSHSWAYGMLGYWCAWYKVHFPVHWLVACLATSDKDRFPAFVMEARRKGFRIDPPDVNESDVEFTVSSDDLGLRYGLASIMGFGPSAATSVIENRPYDSFMDFAERRGAKCNWGNVKTLAHIGAVDSLIPEGSHRNQVEDVIEQMSTGKLEQCAHLREHCQPSMGRDVCCGFNWASEPVTIGKSGKPLKGRPIPKACTKACRQYSPTTAIVWRDLPELSPVDIRRRERDTLGLYVSSTPFDALNLDGVLVATAADLEHADPGYYHIVGEVQSVRDRDDKYGRKMAFLSLLVVDGILDAVCFSKEWADLSAHVRKDSFGMFVVYKNDRGLQLSMFSPMRQE